MALFIRLLVELRLVEPVFHRMALPLDLVMRIIHKTIELADPAPLFPGSPIPSRYLVPRVGARSTHPITAVLFLHGGYFSYHFPTDRACTAQLLPLLDGFSILLSVGYTLQPSASHAEQVTQALESLRHLVHERRISNVVIVGDSAGGNLALSLLLRLADPDVEPAVRDAIAAALFISPWLPPQGVGTRASSADFLHPASLFDPAVCYSAGGGRSIEWFQERLAACSGSLPPSLVIVGGGERARVSRPPVRWPQLIRHTPLSPRPSRSPLSAGPCPLKP